MVMSPTVDDSGRTHANDGGLGVVVGVVVMVVVIVVVGDVVGVVRSHVLNPPCKTSVTISVDETMRRGLWVK